MDISWSNSVITDLFNWVMGLLYSILTADWGALDGSNVANLVSKINQNGLVPIGVSLVNLFVLANVARSTTSYMDLKRPAILIRVAFRLIAADTLVILSYPLFKWLYNLFASIIKVLFSAAGLSGANGFSGLIIGDSTESSFNIITMLPAFILSLISLVAMICVSFSVLLTVMGRFFKIYMYAMLAPVPVSTLSCEGFDRIGKNYLSSFGGVCMEGLAIAAAAVVFAMYIRSGDILKISNGDQVLSQVFGFLGDGAQTIANQVGMLLNMSIFAGMVKGSDRIVREMIG